MCKVVNKTSHLRVVAVASTRGDRAHGIFGVVTVALLQYLVSEMHFPFLDFELFVFQ